MTTTQRPTNEYRTAYGDALYTLVDMTPAEGARCHYRVVAAWSLDGEYVGEYHGYQLGGTTMPDTFDNCYKAILEQAEQWDYAGLLGDGNIPALLAIEDIETGAYVWDLWLGEVTD